jgi:hypothetical protein
VGECVESLLAVLADLDDVAVGIAQVAAEFVAMVVERGILHIP